MDTKLVYVSTKAETVELRLDFATLRSLDALAERWGVSRDVAARRAIQEAVPDSSRATAPAAKIAALKELQRSLSITDVKASEWQTAVHDARR
jgi:predicted transcriptional regulator